jgi:L-fuconolactonase
VTESQGLFVADSQVHIWAADAPGRPWVRGREPHRATPLGAEELLREMDAAGVSRAVLVPPSWDGERNDLVLDAARRYPSRFAAAGRLDFDRPDAREQVAAWRQQPGMFGLRCTFSLPQWAPALAEGRVEWLWVEAERSGLPLMVLVTHAMMPLIDRVAERHPGLKLALCHLGLPTGVRDDEAFRDFEQLLALAKRPNICVKASALPAYTSDPYPFRRTHTFLRCVYDAFGPQRMFWGTDLARLPCSYRQAVTMFTEELPWLGSEDKAQIMGRSLCDWLEWHTPDTSGDLSS